METMKPFHRNENAINCVTPCELVCSIHALMNYDKTQNCTNDHVQHTTNNQWLPVHRQGNSVCEKSPMCSQLRPERAGEK